jgi:two-component SAPR family response regulator
METDALLRRLRGDIAELLAVANDRPEIASAITEIRGALEVKEAGAPIAPTLHVKALGAFRVGGTRGGPQLPAPKRGRDLIAYLVTFPGRTATRDTLGEAFWPNLDSDTVTHRLHIVASGARNFLRDALNGFDALRCTSAGYSLHPAVRIASDVAQFFELQQAGTMDAFKHAVHLYEGEFLAGEQGDWIEPIRVKCATTHAGMLEKHADAALSYGEHQEALGYGLDLLAVDRANEAASRMVMRCFAALGRRGRVLAEYEALRAYLRKHLGLEPTAETRNVVRALVAAGSSAEAPLA